MHKREFSVAVRAAASIAITLFLLFAGVGLWVFLDARERALAQAQDDLASFNAGVVAFYERKFARIEATQSAAAAIFRSRLSELRTGDSGALFADMFPLKEDGTRRSADHLFEVGGSDHPAIDGVGAFIPAGSELSRTRAVAAAQAVFLTGRSVAHDLSSLYFFTPDDALIIYAPGRADGLKYYRKTAPADLSFQDEEFSRLALPAVNPSRKMRCTSMRPIMHADAGSVWTTACVTPFDLGGRHVGSFGTSLLLDDVLDAPFMDGPPDGSLMLVSPEGRLLMPPRLSAGAAALGLAGPAAAATADYPDISSPAVGPLHNVWTLLQSGGAMGADATYSGYSQALEAYVSIRRIPTTGWYTIAMRSNDAVMAEALHPVKRMAIAALLALAVTVVVCLAVTRRMVIGPLRGLARQVRTLAGAALQDRSDLPRRGRDEFAYVSDLVDRMAGEVAKVRAELEQRVARRTFELEAANNKLRMLSERDMLTGVPNRRKIMEDFGAMWESGGPMAVILLDVDHFKSINDRHGHPAGDAVLTQVASRLAGALRQGSLLGRVGGEEFLVVAPVSGTAEADVLAARLRTVIAGSPVDLPDGDDLAVTVSAGVAMRAEGDTRERIYARADYWLYEAKTGGRDIICREGCLFKTASNAPPRRMQAVGR